MAGSQPDKIEMVPKTGGVVTTFLAQAGFPNSESVVGGMAVDATNVYFAGRTAVYAYPRLRARCPRSPR